MSRKSSHWEMRRPDHRFDVTVFENEALTLVRGLDGDVYHRPGQIVRPNHQVGEHQAERRVEPTQQAVAEIRLLPWLDGIDVGWPKDVNTGKPSCEERLFRLPFVASESHPTLPRRVRAIS